MALLRHAEASLSSRDKSSKCYQAQTAGKVELNKRLCYGPAARRLLGQDLVRRLQHLVHLRVPVHAGGSGCEPCAVCLGCQVPSSASL
jgi:hypothetical protein